MGGGAEPKSRPSRLAFHHRQCPHETETFVSKDSCLTEYYFCGSYNFDVGKDQGGYREFTTPYSGLAQVIRPDGLYRSQMRFGMYRWHMTDPIRFERDLRVTIQALGWRSGGRYLPLQDDIASLAYWYQTLPTAPFPPLPDADYLEVI